MKKDVDELLSGLFDEDVGIRRISAQNIENIAREDPLKIKEIIPEIFEKLQLKYSTSQGLNGIR